MKPLKDQLEEKLPWLFSELGFRIVSYSYDPASFGNSVVVLESDAFRLCLSRDRSFIAATVASVSDPEREFQFNFLWETIFGELPEPNLEGFGPLIRQGFPAFADALGPKYLQTKEAYDQREKERQRILAEYFAGRGRMYRPTAWRLIRQILTNPFGWVLLTSILALILWLILER